MIYSEAKALLPANTKWSSSFGNPGEGGYVEYWRDPNGVRYVVSNGDWLACAPFDWATHLLESDRAVSL
jgi:hypothetical protein